MMNHFNTLSFDVTFAIDVDALEDKYLSFQKQFHPDNASSADVEKSIAINASYAVLKNPITRASHILQLHGIDLENDALAPKPDMETLEEILALQEKVAQIDVAEKAQLKHYLSGEVTMLLKQVASDIEKKDFNQAAQVLIRAKYFEKTLKDLKAKK